MINGVLYKTKRAEAIPSFSWHFSGSPMVSLLGPDSWLHSLAQGDKPKRLLEKRPVKGAFSVPLQRLSQFITIITNGAILFLTTMPFKMTLGKTESIRAKSLQKVETNPEKKPQQNRDIGELGMTESTGYSECIYCAVFTVFQKTLRFPYLLNLLRSNETSCNFILKYRFTTQQQQ